MLMSFRVVSGAKVRQGRETSTHFVRELTAGDEIEVLEQYDGEQYDERACHPPRDGHVSPNASVRDDEMHSLCVYCVV